MIVVFYDGWCPLCTAVAARTKKFDGKGRTTFVSFRENEIVQRYHVTPRLLESMQDRMHVYDGRQWHEGIDAVRKLAQAVPAYWPAVPFIQFSIWIGMGRYLYDFVAKRRAIVPTGHCKDDVCEIRKGNGGK